MHTFSSKFSISNVHAYERRQVGVENSSLQYFYNLSTARGACGILNVTHQNAASVHFRPSITRTDILVNKCINAPSFL